MTVVATSIVEAYLLIFFVEFQMLYFSEHSLISWHSHCDQTDSHATSEWLRRRWWSCAVRSAMRRWSCLTVWHLSRPKHPTRKCVMVGKGSQENKSKREKKKEKERKKKIALRRRVTNNIVMFFAFFFLRRKMHRLCWEAKNKHSTTTYIRHLQNSNEKSYEFPTSCDDFSCYFIIAYTF